jgi:formylglycine-generating enzyme required for sulfatase activity
MKKNHLVFRLAKGLLAFGVVCCLGVLAFAQIPSTPDRRKPPPKKPNKTSDTKNNQGGDQIPKAPSIRYLPARAGEESENAKDGSTMVRIPEGWFRMGSPKGVGEDDERPLHNVYLDSYRIGKYEVTVAQFRKYCDATGYRYRWDDRKPPWGYVESYPMVRVTWGEANSYCVWAGGRLATEAEWEKAARGTDGRKYPWGGSFDSSLCVNSVVTTVSHPESVGSKSGDRSPYGVMDMGGNVLEWCSDYYDSTYYARSPQKNPKGNNSGYKVFRGGCWNGTFAGNFRCADRDSLRPDGGSGDLGFRLVLP